MSPTRAQPIDIAANAIAVGTFVLIVVRALTTADGNWDTLQYHWSFAARAAGLCDSQCFALDHALLSRYLSFPMLFHTAYGLLWRTFGTPLAGHAATIGVVVALCAYLWRRFAVPLAWSWLALLAVPLVQIHLTASYVDLAANAALTIGILALLRLLTLPGPSPVVDIVVAWTALTLAAGAKLLLIPLAALVWVAIVVTVALAHRRRDGRIPALYVTGLVLLGAVSILPQLALNIWHFHNPFYPVSIRVFGVQLPGDETLRNIQHTMSVSTQWFGYPGWLRWGASVLEFDAFRGRILPWTIDQADVLRSSPSFRMGGYFCVYVLGLAALLASRARERGTRPLLWLFAVATLACALLPNSHELRYYLFWMLMLVSIVLALAFAPALATGAQPQTRQLSGLLILLSLAGVVTMTGAQYFIPAALTVDAMVAPTREVVDSLPPDSTLCAANRNRHAILYSRLFHPHSSVHVRVIEGANAAGCDHVIDPP